MTYNMKSEWIDIQNIGIRLKKETGLESIKTNWTICAINERKWILVQKDKSMKGSRLLLQSSLHFSSLIGEIELRREAGTLIDGRCLVT